MAEAVAKLNSANATVILRNGSPVLVVRNVTPALREAAKLAGFGDLVEAA